MADNTVNRRFHDRGQTIQSTGGFMTEDRQYSQQEVSWQRTDNMVSRGFHDKGQTIRSARSFMAENRLHREHGVSWRRIDNTVIAEDRQHSQ